MLTKDRPINEYPEVLDARMIATIMGIGYVKALHTIKYGGIRYLKLGNVQSSPVIIHHLARARGTAPRPVITHTQFRS